MANAYETKATRRAPPPATPRQEKLTPRQLEVLALVCEGLSNKLIARRLDMASSTVKVHIVRILRALNVSSRLQAAIAATRLGLLEKSGEAASAPVVSVSLPPQSQAIGQRVSGAESGHSLAVSAG